MCGEGEGAQKGPPGGLCFLHLPRHIKTNLCCGQKPTAPSWHRRISQLLLLRKTKWHVKVAVPWPSGPRVHRGQSERQNPAGTDSLSPAQGQPLASHQVGDPLVHEVSFRGLPQQKAACTPRVFRVVQEAAATQRERPAGMSSQVQRLYGAPKGLPGTAPHIHRPRAPSLGTGEKLRQCLEIGA